MTGEEIQLKIGLDASEFSRGTRDASEKLESFAHHGAQEFGRLGGAGRVVTSVLREISASAPKVGEALTIAFGAVGIAGIAYKVLIERIQEYNKNLDETAKKMSEPIFGEDKARQLRNDLEAIDKQLDKIRKEQKLNPITARVEEIANEKDPKTQASFARQALRQFDIQSKEINKALEDLAQRRKQMTAQSKLGESFAESAKTLLTPETAPLPTNTPLRSLLKLFGVAGGPGGIAGVGQFQPGAEGSIAAGPMLTGKLTESQKRLEEQLKASNKAFDDQEKRVLELSKGISELQKLLDKIDPGWTTRPLLQIGRGPGSFSLSSTGFGTPAGFKTVFDENGAYLQALASCVESGFLRAKIPNGP